MNYRHQPLLLAFMFCMLGTVASAADRWPLPVEVLVPFAPTPFQSGGRTHLAYELHLRNFSSDTVALRSVEVLDAAKPSAPPLAAYTATEFASLLQPIGYSLDGASADATQLPPGASIVVFMWVSLAPAAKVPDRLSHRVITTDNEARAPAVAMQRGLREFTSPVTGTNWKANNGPSNDAENHHRRGVVVVDGRAVISRRYAVDWVQVENGATFTGDKRNKLAYHAYAEPLRAVADATVVAVTDGLPDNVPGHNEEFSPAVPITMATVAGNTVVLDLGGGLFAHYFHVQAGSIQVKTGDRVRRGQRIARIGGSGDAREPHLHFEVTTSAKLIAGEGVPYVIDEYRITAANGQPAGSRKRELPLKNEVVDFD
jgi:murein DD-endopeptidase MepM/ murein hydrolase activator NlpD